jgi:hypothetical protein
MRFMMIVKANKDSEVGKMPSEELLAAMAKYNDELMKAGVLVDLSGLQSSAKGARIKFWAKRAPNPHGEGQEAEIEIRQFFELEDFAPSAAIDQHRELGKKLEKKKAS